MTTASRKGARVRPAPTLEEVAARAGVSRATASRVLRGDAKVSERAREAVLAAADAISYVPNLAARSLVTGRSDSIAFLVEETEERMFADPFFLGMLRSAQEAVAGAGLQLVFTVMNRAEDQQRFLAYAAGGHVDGVLLLSLHGQDQLPQRLEALGVPTVLSGRPLSGRRRLWYVDADNVGGGRLATQHLLSSGRRHVATVAGPLDMCAGQDRLAGYRGDDVAVIGFDDPGRGSVGGHRGGPHGPKLQASHRCGPAGGRRARRVHPRRLRQLELVDGGGDGRCRGRAVRDDRRHHPHRGLHPEPGR